MVEKEIKPKKMGAPLKERKGKLIFIPAELIDRVQLMVVEARNARKELKQQKI